MQGRHNVANMGETIEDEKQFYCGSHAYIKPTDYTAVDGLLPNCLRGNNRDVHGSENHVRVCRTAKEVATLAAASTFRPWDD